MTFGSLFLSNFILFFQISLFSLSSLLSGVCGVFEGGDCLLVDRVLALENGMNRLLIRNKVRILLSTQKILKPIFHQALPFFRVGANEMYM